MLWMSTVGAWRVQAIAEGSNDRSESKAKRDGHVSSICMACSFVWVSCVGRLLIKNWYLSNSDLTENKTFHITKRSAVYTVDTVYTRALLLRQARYYTLNYIIVTAWLAVIRVAPFFNSRCIIDCWYSPSPVFDYWSSLLMKIPSRDCFRIMLLLFCRTQGNIFVNLLHFYHYRTRFLASKPAHLKTFLFCDMHFTIIVLFLLVY